MDRFKPKKGEEDFDQEEDEELDLVCAYPEEDSSELIEQKTDVDTESVSKVIKGVTFNIKETDNLSLATKESVKSTNHNFDDFGLEKSEVISLDEFQDDEFQNELSE